MRLRRPKGQFKTTCSKCGNELEEQRKGKYRYCLKCHAESMKKSRKMEINTHIHILHLPARKDRMETLMNEFSEQRITNYTIIEGQRDLAAVFRGINNSHKSIIRLAKAQKLPNCIIGEDDLKFTAPGAWNYFLEQLELNKDADIFLSMIYEGVVDENNRVVKNPFSFSGLTLYSVNSKFYDQFLGMKDMNHLDKELGSFADKYDFRVCDPFAAIQYNGYSDQKKKDCQYDHLLVGIKLFGVNS